MPPVFGPRSPSPMRLKSCAAPSDTRPRPSARANSDTSSPSRSSSTTTSPPSAAAARSPSASSSCDRQTKTPLPAARPSAFTTQGACGVVSRLAVGTPAATMTSLPNAFDPSIRAAAALGPKTARPFRRSSSPTPATSGASGPITTRSAPTVPREVDEAVGVVGSNRVTVGDGCDAGVARRGVEHGETRAPGELPGESVLARTRADEQDLHAASLRPAGSVTAGTFSR